MIRCVFPVTLGGVISKNLFFFLTQFGWKFNLDLLPVQYGRYILISELIAFQRLIQPIQVQTSVAANVGQCGNTSGGRTIGGNHVPQSGEEASVDEWTEVAGSVEESGCSASCEGDKVDPMNFAENTTDKKGAEGVYLMELYPRNLHQVSWHSVDIILASL